MKWFRLINALTLAGLWLTVAVGASLAVEHNGIFPGKHWQMAKNPEKLGWSSEKLDITRDYSEKIQAAAVMIVEDGIVIAGWGDLARKYRCHSIRKSLLSALIGIHVESDHIDLSKTLEALGIDDNAPSLSSLEKKATVADLIKSRSGIYHPALFESADMRAKRPQRFSHAPGTFWYYNNWDFNALGTIFEQESATSIFEEFDHRIAKPLQMEDFNPNDCRYVSGADSIHPAYPFRMSTRDLARFGLLYLREGCWQNQRVIPSSWIRDSTVSHSRVDVDKGYGYMWWTGVRGGLFPNVNIKEPSYFAAGYRGHRVIVLPYRHLVIVIRFDTDQGAGYLTDVQIGTLVWLILDAAGEKGIGEAAHISAAKGNRLAGNQLSKVLTANNVKGPDYTVSFSRDGSLSVTSKQKQIDGGHWWIEANNLCVRWDRLNHGLPERLLLMKDNASIKWFDLDGTLKGKAVLSPK